MNVPSKVGTKYDEVEVTVIWSPIDSWQAEEHLTFYTRQKCQIISLPCWTSIYDA